MPNPIDAILAQIERGNQKRKANALNDIFAKSYEPGASIPFVDEQAQAMGLPQEPGMIAGNQPGRINVQNALAQMAQSKEPGFAMQAFQLQQDMDKQELEKQKAIKSSGAGPMDVQETLWYMQQPPETQKQHLALKRAQQLMNLGGTQAVLDQTTGQISQSYQVTPKPDQMPSFQGAQSRAKKEGTMEGEQSAELSEMEANLPRIEIVAGQLSELGNKSTYTTSGKIYDVVRKEAGLQTREAAIARKEYISKVDNEVLPLLRQTFGSAFTQKEGESLKATLGDADASPEEKDAVLRSFIDSKRAQVETQKRKLGMSAKEYAGVTKVTSQSDKQNPKNTSYKVNGLTKGPDGRMYLIRSLKSDGTPDEVIPAQ